MAKKIYFAGSIRGGRVDADLYHRIISYIQRTDVVLTEHVGKSNLCLTEQGRSRDSAIYDQDTAWLRFRLQNPLFIKVFKGYAIGLSLRLSP